MKKFLYSFLILTILLIPSTVFAGKAWSETELEEFFKNMGYGEHDLSTFETTDTSSLNTFFYRLNDSFYNKIFIKIPESNVFWLFVTGDSTVSFYLKSDQYVLRGNYGSTPTCYQFDLDNKTFYYPNSQTYVGYVPSTWKKENYTVTEEEWNSTEFKTFLFEQVCIYSDIRIENTNYIAQGGRIVNSSFGDTIYTGSISYGNTTETATITYTSGFDSSASYDLFLERYQLSESYDYGIAEYPLTTYDLASLTTSDTSFKVDISNFALSSNSVYRLCLGKNTFEDTGSNDVYLCTDWLLPNNNTLWKFPTFTRSHYFQPLNLVAYDSNYQDPVIPDDPGGSSSGDVIDSILGGLEPYFYNNLEGYYDLLTTDKLYLKIHDNNFDLIDINYYFLKLDIGKMSGDEQIHTGSVIIDSGDLWLPGNYAFPVYTINLKDYFEFQNYDYFYQISLYDYDNNLIDRTSVFWFDETLFIETNFFEDIWNMLKKIFNTIAAIPGTIIDFLVVDLDDLKALWSTINDRFIFIENIKAAITDFEAIMQGIEPAPTLSLTVGATKWTEERKVNIIDLEWYIPFKEFGDMILTGFIYITFLWRTFTHLPNIINGIGGGIEASYQASDINTYLHTGFGRGDGKNHQFLNRRR